MPEAKTEPGMERGFVIVDDGQADWAARKIAEAEAEKQKMAEFYKSRMEAVDMRCNSTIEYMQGLLYAYFVTVPHTVTKTEIEKYTLPSATLVYKPTAIDYERDEDTLLAWAKANNPDFVNVTEEAKWAEVKAYIKQTGEIPDGVKPVEKPGSFEVKINA